MMIACEASASRTSLSEMPPTPFKSRRMGTSSFSSFASSFDRLERPLDISFKDQVQAL